MTGQIPVPGRAPDGAPGQGEARAARPAISSPNRLPPQPDTRTHAL
jgi:hypothetical protein